MPTKSIKLSEETYKKLVEIAGKLQSERSKNHWMRGGRLGEVRGLGGLRGLEPYGLLRHRCPHRPFKRISADC